jgi:YVTN family beta-propeller protein
MNTLKLFSPLLMLLLLLNGCKKNDSITDAGQLPSAANAVYIVNEGGYNKGNASLTMYLPDAGTAYQDVFASVNGRNLGDVAQDMVIYGKNAYIVVNNSQKIEVVTLETMKSVGTITIPGSKSPYKIAIYSDTKGYVTNLYDNSVTVFNPTSLAIVKERIPVGLNPQEIILANGKLYVCNSGYGADSTVSVIDPLTDAVVKTIVVGKSPSQIGTSVDGKLIVNCLGESTDYTDPTKGPAGSIVKIDPATQTVTGSLVLPTAVYGHPSKMAISPLGYAYVAVMGSVLKMETATMTVVNAKFIPLTTENIYGMAYDNATNRLYLADAGGFVSAGTVTIYDATGQSVTSFKSGIASSTIVFKSAAK